jgi:hypothetical protein
VAVQANGFPLVNPTRQYGARCGTESEVATFLTEAAQSSPLAMMLPS